MWYMYAKHDLANSLLTQTWNSTFKLVAMNDLLSRHFSAGRYEIIMMMSSNRNMFRVTAPLWGESTGCRRITLTKASDAEHYLSLICAWTYGWVNNWDAGDFRRHRAHHGITVITIKPLVCQIDVFEYSSVCFRYARIVLVRWRPLRMMNTTITSSNGNIFRITGPCAGHSLIIVEFPA